MGNKNLKALFIIISAIVIMLFTGTFNKTDVMAKTSDFRIKDGVLEQYLGSNIEIVIPNSVKTIGVGAFKDCTIEKVSIPNSVNIIEDKAFQNCTKLTEIVIPGSVTKLGDSAFRGCSSLYRAELSEKIFSIGNSAFEDCTSLKEVIIPDGVHAIFPYAFKDCTSLELIDLPESISYILAGCFENCTSLETILFPTREAYIGYKALYNTPWLENYVGEYVIINHTLIQYRGNEADITIPKNITVIGENAFENCSSITNVTIPLGVKEISNSAFAGCSGLTQIVLPESVTKVDKFSFKDCNNLANITLPKGVIIYRDSLEGTKWMADYKGDFIILNGSLLSYQGTASKVVIPDNVITVCSEAFKQNHLITEVTVPKSVKNIYYSGFWFCDNLQKVFITGKNTNLDYYAFDNCSSDLKLYGSKGGTAEDYAKMYNITFVSYGISKTKVILYLGGNNSTSLSTNGEDGDIQWVSEDVAIAKVSKNGKVTAVKLGSTKIKAIVNGITMTCEITVKKPYISKSSLKVYVGLTSRLNIIGISSGITWSSSNKSIASVDGTGVITANKTGTATITAKVNGKKYTCKVTVTVK